MFVCITILIAMRNTTFRRNCISGKVEIIFFEKEKPEILKRGTEPPPPS
jgi:hypothetical protein